MEFIPSSLAVENEYPKLVRDNIPDIIEKKVGKQPLQRILVNDGEFLQYLLKKVVEESIELEYSVQKGNMEEELADVFELLQTLMALQNISMDDVAKVQKEKREKNGGFQKRILMLSKE